MLNEVHEAWYGREELAQTVKLLSIVERDHIISGCADADAYLTEETQEAICSIPPFCTSGVGLHGIRMKQRILPLAT